MAAILISGNTQLFTEDMLRRLAEEYTVVVTADEGKQPVPEKEKNIKVYHTHPGEESFHQLFDVYTFQAVYYISGYADGGRGLFGETQQLEQVMLECGRSHAEKLVVLTTIESQNYILGYEGPAELEKKEYHTSWNFAAGQLEDMCRYFTEKMKVRTVILRLPYLADRINEHNFLGEVFRCMYEQERVMLPYHRDDPVDFLTMRDLADLLYQVTDETEDEGGVYDVVSGYHYTYGDLEDMLKLAVPGQQVVYENYPFTVQLPDYPHELRRGYGFIPKDNVMENIGACYRIYTREVAGGRRGLGGKLARIASKIGRNVFKYLELIVVFLAAEIISHFTSDSIYFRFIDVRLCYIMIMGTIHGMRMGLLAAALECLVLIREFAVMGMSGTLLFYNIENWIPFVVYLMAGSITGYVSDKKSDALSFNKWQYSLLRDKYLFLSNVYHGAVENKGEYKRQILGFKDSFGKIFDAVQRLDSELPESIYFHGLKVLEDILENHTIAIYTLDSWQRFGRLAVCSSSQLKRLTKSIRIEDYRPVYEKVKSGQVWKNTEMLEGYPMYACGIFNEGEMVLMVTIQEAQPEQYGMHYMNIFQILCGLVQTSFLRAREYEELAENRIYYPNTNIIYPDRFRQLLDVQMDMKAAGVADYVLVRFYDDDKERISGLLAGVVRASDVLGCDEDGTVYLLLVQMNEKNFRIVGDRLREKGLRYGIVGQEDRRAD